MKGTILQFENNSHAGLISGHDGKRYKFSRQNFASDSAVIVEGAEVDFNPNNDQATEIFLIKATKGNKQKTAALLLALFLGGLGGHHFYLGNTGAGVLSLLFFWTFIPAIIALINLVQLICMNEQKFNEKFNV